MHGGTKRRIAVIGIGSNSYTNSHVLKTLGATFPEYDVDWLDLGKVIKRRTHGLAGVLSAIAAAREFATEMGPKLHELRWRRGWASYLFELRSRVARDLVARAPYAFSFQIQSHFDASVRNVPHFVYTDHTLLAHRAFPDIGGVRFSVTPKWLELEHQLYRNAQTNFVMSQHVRRSLIDDYGCDPQRVVCAYGGPNAEVTPAPDKTYDAKEILFVGVHWIRKGGPQLVEAFRRVRARIPNARLTIVGSSPDIRVEGIEVLGRVPPSELGTYYKRASVFCMPTRFEPFGIVYLEAMAYKLPIVATDVGAIPDFVQNGANGFRTKPGDVDDLADKLTTLLLSPSLCKTMGERSFEIAKEYTWERTGRIFRDTIESHVNAYALEGR